MLAIKFIIFLELILINYCQTENMENNRHNSSFNHGNIVYYNPETTADFIRCLGQQLSDIDSLIQKSKKMIDSHDCIHRYKQHIGNSSD